MTGQSRMARSVNAARSSGTPWSQCNLPLHSCLGHHSSVAARSAILPPRDTGRIPLPVNWLSLVVERLFPEANSCGLTSSMR